MSAIVRSGKLIGVGVGPGDPELMTVKATRSLRGADVIAYFAKAGNPSHSRATIGQYLRAGIIELPLAYPVTTELPKCTAGYRDALESFYARAAADIAGHLEAGRVVAVICEGDPMFYGSYMHLHAAPGAAFCHGGYRRSDRHVGLLVGGSNADRSRRRRLYRAAGDPARERARAAPCGGRCRGGDEGGPALAETAARAGA